ncbi:MAG: 3-hydroxyacyl-CoA dehydrogenase NAD-binding domain-containing protein [Pikeienuella sp.]
MSGSFHLSVADGIATITWDQPGTRMNVLNEAGVRELDACIDQVLADPLVRAAIITSAKPDFAGGMDLDTLAQLRGRAAAQGDVAAKLFGFVMALHRVLRKIERAGADPKTLKGGKPFVWACPGTAMGIGVEIGLACHHRIAADRPGVQIGLPEIKVGLFPGAGGTTRLVRMLGLMAAAPFLLEGKTPPPIRAKAAGLVDAIVAPDALREAARAWAAAAGEADAVKPWDRKGFKIPGGGPYSREGFELFLGAAAMTHGRSQGVYPAAKAVLRAVYEGALVPIDTALRIEARHFTAVLLDPTAAAMIRTLFLDKQALEKGAARPRAEPAAQVARLGVLGAGMMGAGISEVAAQAGIDVVLLDRDADSAEAGRARVAASLDEAKAKRRIGADERDRTLSRITATADYGALASCDLVVEAVFEDPAVKADVTRRAEAHLPATAVFATNTSTLPVSELAQASIRPDKFIGIHFFSPVSKMMLVEIIRGRETGLAAEARAHDFVRQLRKTPIIVNDARFFYANRCIIPYINEGLEMVTEGVLPALVENAARGLGMPVGPLQLVDETSLELGLSIQRSVAAAQGAAYARSGADDLLEELVGRGRLGRKSGAGLYAYDAKGRRLGIWPGLGEIWPAVPAQPGVAELRDRLTLIQALEAVRALEEGVLSAPRDGDVAAILGWGFLPWAGGPFSWLDRIGPADAVARAERLADAHGARFTPPDLLRQMAAEDRRFRSDAASAAA